MRYAPLLTLFFAQKIHLTIVVARILRIFIVSAVEIAPLSRQHVHITAAKSKLHLGLFAWNMHHANSDHFF